MGCSSSSNQVSGVGCAGSAPAPNIGSGSSTSMFAVLAEAQLMIEAGKEVYLVVNHVAKGGYGIINSLAEGAGYDIDPFRCDEDILEYVAVGNKILAMWASEKSDFESLGPASQVHSIAEILTHFDKDLTEDIVSQVQDFRRKIFPPWVKSQLFKGDTEARKALLQGKYWGLQQTDAFQTALMKILDTAQGKMVSRCSDNNCCTVTNVTMSSKGILALDFEVVISGQPPTGWTGEWHIFNPQTSMVEWKGGQAKPDFKESQLDIYEPTECVQGHYVFNKVRTDCELNFQYSGREDYSKCLLHLTHPDAMLLPQYWDKTILEPFYIKPNLGLDIRDSEDVHGLGSKHKTGINFFTSILIGEGELATFQKLFDGSLRKTYTRDRKGGSVPDRLQLTRGKRIQNLKNWLEYSARRWEVKEQMKQQGEGLVDSIKELKTEGLLPESSDGRYRLEREANEAWLFHGTNDIAADCITNGDFLVNLAGSNAGTLYGKGIYLAESCSKSDEYTQENDSGERCMLLCKSTLGSVNYNNENRPDTDALVQSCVSGPHHCVLGDREKLHGTFREIVVFDDNQAYPEYVFWYRRVYDDK